MAWSFGDGFDLYAVPADAINGYWDSGTAAFSLATGRFPGSRALAISGSSYYLVKSSGANDAVHHLVFAFAWPGTLGGSGLFCTMQLLDGATVQCSISFRQDGAILLHSGNVSTLLATYTGAFPGSSIWTAFEIEVVINNATGSFTVRKNGNASNDFTATGLNTRGGTANNYANRFQIGSQNTGNAELVDDLFWRSDASSVAWMGDIRCYTRMPNVDASLHFTPSASAYPLLAAVNAGTAGFGTNLARYTPFTPSFSGTVGSILLPVSTASTGNVKCCIYSTVGGVPAIVLGSATPVAAPALGNAIFTFGTPVSVTAGTQYFAAICADSNSGQHGVGSAALGFNWGAATYASFPTNNPGPLTSGANTLPVTINITPTTTASFAFVSEPQQDGTVSYVYDTNPTDADFYGIAGIPITPTTTIATTTRAYVQKADAGTRAGAVQLKSGATTVQSPTLPALGVAAFTWAWRMDLVDPNTGAAWTATAVNNAQIGPIVTA